MKTFIIWQHANVRRRCSVEFEAENDEQAKLVFNHAVKDEYAFNWRIRKYDEDCDVPDISVELAEIVPGGMERTICGLDVKDGEPSHRDAIEFVKQVAAMNADDALDYRLQFYNLIRAAQKLIPKE